MKVKVNDATGVVLDWLAAKAEERLGLTGLDQAHGVVVIGNFLYTRNDDGECEWWSPSTDWSQGGPIIEREWLDITPWANESDEALRWQCIQHDSVDCVAFFGPTPLIAAMRCFVTSHLGEEVDVPEELI